MIKITVLSEDKCLLIRKIVEGGKSDTMTKCELLCYLPSYIFGETIDVDRFNENIITYRFHDEIWSIPPYFIESITRL